MTQTPLEIALERIAECRRTRSTTLNLSGLGLEEIPEQVFELTWLEKLDCCGNYIHNFSSLAQIFKLTELDCSFNEISDLNLLMYLPNLTKLDCSHNQITDLSTLVYLTRLASLFCSENQISDLSPLMHTPNLVEFDCSFNQICDLSPLAHTRKLISLSCYVNQIHNLSSLTHVSNLTELFCNDNQISDLSSIYHKVMSEQLKEVSLSYNPVFGIPIGILGIDPLENCAESLRNYWLDLTKGSEWKRQLKVQLVGNGRVGKSTLAYALEHKRAPSEAFKSTHSIVIKEIKQALEGDAEPITLHLWDFGGQEIYHATHRLFLADDCLYLLLWAEETAEQEQDETLHPPSYWLELIHDLGPSSPVILVKNQIDRADRLAIEPMDVHEDSAGFKQIKQAVKISALGYRNMSTLRGAIESVLEELKPRICVQLPSSWLQVERDLKQLEQKTIPLGHFQQLCLNAGVSDAQWFVDYLHKTGVLFYRKGAFQDQIILDQNWAIDAAYKVFDPQGMREEIEEKRGKFKGKFARFIWPEVDDAERQIYLDFMRNCGICYEPNRWQNKPFAEREYIIPALLPTDSSAHQAWRKQPEDWLLEIDYPFLHRSIIERLILRLGETYKGEAWRNGIFCETEYGNVLLECVHHAATLKSANAGQLCFHLEAKQQPNQLLLVLRKLVQEISPHRRYKEYLTQGQKGRQELLAFTQAEEQLSQSRLDPIEPTNSISLFISYSRANLSHRLTLEKHLRLITEAVKPQGKLEIWSDYCMRAGEEVDEQILSQLRAADIIILMVSADFLDPARYSCRVELPIALDRFQQENIPVIPVLLEPTNWQQKLGHLTVPTKENADSLEDWPSPAKFWLSVENGIRTQVEELLRA